MIKIIDNGVYMKESFTRSAKAAIDTARTLAYKWGHNYTGSEHLLMGLLSIENSTACMVLKNADISREKVMKLIDDLVIRQQKEQPARVKLADTPDLSPKAVEILETAKVEATRMMEKQCGTEHILMAILQSKDSVAIRLLNTLGIEA